MLPLNCVVLRFAFLLALCFNAYVPAALAASGAAAARPALGNGAASAGVHPIHIIVGFMGGHVRPDNLVHKEATVAQDLREPGMANLHVLVFANRDGATALKDLLGLIDQDGDHSISDAERMAVSIAIYGHSWGASETVALARSLQREGIPVALTVQVDSVQKCGENDRAIPSNVQEAVNLYQRGGLLRGRSSIHAEDATRTRILVNQQYHYGAEHTVDIARFPWFARTFMRQHIMIENDPEVWARVESFLRDAMQDQRIEPVEDRITAMVTEPRIAR